MAIKFRPTFLDVGPTLENSFSPNVLFIRGIVLNQHLLVCRRCAVLRYSLGMQVCPDFYITPNALLSSKLISRALIFRNTR